ncbi:unnamed protein product, partial [Polarella glacialis]
PPRAQHPLPPSLPATLWSRQQRHSKLTMMRVVLGPDKAVLTTRRSPAQTEVTSCPSSLVQGRRQQRPSAKPQKDLCPRSPQLTARKAACYPRSPSTSMRATAPRAAQLVPVETETAKTMRAVDAALRAVQGALKGAACARQRNPAASAEAYGLRKIGTINLQSSSCPLSGEGPAAAPGCRLAEARRSQKQRVRATERSVEFASSLKEKLENLFDSEDPVARRAVVDPHPEASGACPRHRAAGDARAEGLRQLVWSAGGAAEFTGLQGAVAKCRRQRLAHIRGPLLDRTS